MGLPPQRRRRSNQPRAPPAPGSRVAAPDPPPLPCGCQVSDLSKELENGRLLRLLVKLGFINERPEGDMVRAPALEAKALAQQDQSQSVGGRPHQRGLPLGLCAANHEALPEAPSLPHPGVVWRRLDGHASPRARPCALSPPVDEPVV